MRPVQYALSAAGAGRWVPLDYIAAPFQVTLDWKLSSDGNMTATIQYTNDLIGTEGEKIVTASQAAFTVTITDPLGHGMVTGDCAIPYGSLAGIDFIDGVDVTVTGPTTYTYTALISQTLTNRPMYAKHLHVRNAPTLTTITTDGVDTIQSPCRAVRAYVTIYAAGKGYFSVLQGHKGI